MKRRNIASDNTHTLSHPLNPEISISTSGILTRPIFSLDLPCPRRWIVGFFSYILFFFFCLFSLHGCVLCYRKAERAQTSRATTPTTTPPPTTTTTARGDDVGDPVRTLKRKRTKDSKDNSAILLSGCTNHFGD